MGRRKIESSGDIMEHKRFCTVDFPNFSYSIFAFCSHITLLHYQSKKEDYYCELPVAVNQSPTFDNSYRSAIICGPADLS